MDLKKAKILLDKINALYKNLSADKDNISTIEKDLMRSYIQQLYESFLDLPASSNAAPAVEIIKSTPKVRVKKTPPKVVTPPPPKPAPAAKTPPPPAPAPKAKKAAPAPPPPPPPAPKPKPVPKAAPAPPVATGEMEELFAMNSAKELSEKLSELPIKDIKKAMGLNERIFTVNELFGGDQAAFDAVTTTLNGLKNFDAAKGYLIRNVAGKYKWAAKTRKNKAKNFIKLVKRRYN